MRASKILEAMEAAHSNHRGAVGLSMNGRDEMIDAPMLRQVKVLCLTLALLVKVNDFAVIGNTNHPTRKKSRVTHPAVQLINVNTRMSASKVNAKAKRWEGGGARGPIVYGCVL